MMMMDDIYENELPLRIGSGCGPLKTSNDDVRNQ